MKSRLAALGLMICSVLAAGASGQNKFQQFVLQDDSTGSYLEFDLSGSYLYVNCDKDYSVEGVGTAKISGCNVTLEAIDRDRLVQASADMCEAMGKAAIQFRAPCLSGRDCEPLRFIISDSNLTDSAAGCKKLN